MADKRTKKKAAKKAKKKAAKRAKPKTEPVDTEPVDDDPPPPMPDIPTGLIVPPVSEVAAVAAAQHARAMVEAKCLLAMRRPRSLARVRERLLADCNRPRFIEAARYSVPVGGGKTARGWSIRFAEAAMQAMTNIYAAVQVIYDDAEKRGLRIEVMDLETNVSADAQWILQKTVERKSPKGRTVLSQRINSENEVTYLVEATEAEMLQKQNALASKAMRNCILRLVPGDILDECLERIHKPVDEKTMAKRIKRTADRFEGIGIQVAALEELLGHALGDSTPDELQDLWGIFTSLREGEVAWADIRKRPERETGSLKPSDLEGKGRDTNAA